MSNVNTTTTTTDSAPTVTAGPSIPVAANIAAEQKGSAEGRVNAFNPAFIEEKSRKRMARLIVKATMIASGTEPPSGQWDSAEKALAWLENEASQLPVAPVAKVA